MIKFIKAKQILNSRKEPTIEVKLQTENGVFSASVPSGASVGEHEALSLKAEKAAKNISRIIAPLLKGRKFDNQKEFDKFLIDLDGTENKSKLGVNAILPLSLAFCRYSANKAGLELFEHINKSFRIKKPKKLPRPCFNILEGGVHADNDLDIQEFMIVPLKDSFEENLKIGREVYQELKEILKNKFGNCLKGDEGGFSPPLKRNIKALKLVFKAVKEAGYGKEVELGLDCAASEFFEEGKYNFEGKDITARELIKKYKKMIKKIPIIFLEDPFDQNDWSSWKRLKSALEKRKNKRIKKMILVGDDLLTTNPKRIRKIAKKRICNAMILKPNQIGTVSEAIKAGLLAKRKKWKIIVSHRSGETEDDFIADLAVGLGADFIKSGAPGPRERMAKYNRLLNIEKKL